MHVILGGTGHIGSALAVRLLASGEQVTVVTRDEGKAAAWRARGASVAIVDVHDTATLRKLLAPGRRLFLLNPPAAPSTDTEVEERRSSHAILSAVEGTDLERVVAASTYGAQPGTNIGDLGVLHEMEQGLATMRVPAAVLRSAYYMSNWDHALESARTEGKVHTFFPVDFVLPMVAPQDIAERAAELMLEGAGQGAVHHVEGPTRYSPADVAAAFASALGRDVKAEEIPPSAWIDAMKTIGFSDRAAASFAGMTRAALAATYPDVSEVTRGSTSLTRYVADLVAASR